MGDLIPIAGLSRSEVTRHHGLADNKRSEQRVVVFSGCECEMCGSCVRFVYGNPHYWKDFSVVY